MMPPLLLTLLLVFVAPTPLDWVRILEPYVVGVNNIVGISELYARN